MLKTKTTAPTKTPQRILTPEKGVSKVHRQKHSRKKIKPSVFDLTKDLCGAVDSGVTDLATNKKHLDGYGK